MRNRLFGIVMVALLSIGVAGAQQPSADVELQAAIRTETVTRDLRKAIAAYQAIVDKYTKVDRASAATALVRMAECHEKLGSAEAARLFERVLREFSDQNEAVRMASARLRKPASRELSGMISRQVWTGPLVDSFGSISADGRYISHTDWSTGDLALRDLSTGTSRRLTDKGPRSQSPDYAEETVMSPDGSQVAYSWYTGITDRYQLRILRTDGPPGTPPRVLFDNPDVIWIAPYDWSSDGKRLAVHVQRVDRTAQIGLVSVIDGTYTPLKSIDWRGTTRIFFSPDGALVAYDLPQPGPDLARDVYLLSVDGAREVAVAPHQANERVMGWSPDGSTLLIASDRAESTGLWSVPVAKGQPAGLPSLIKPDMTALGRSFGVSRRGTLAYAVRTATPKVVVAGVDFQTGQRRSAPVFPFETYLTRTNQADWSPDGTSIVARQEFSRAQTGLTIRTAEGRPVRDLAPDLAYFQRPRWAPDGSITVQGTDLKGRQGIFRVDAKSGVVSPVVLSDPPGSLGQASWTPDGKSLVFRRNGEKGARVVVRDIASGGERTLLEQMLSGLSLSRDGRHVAYLLFDVASKSTSVYTMPIEGGTPTLLGTVAGRARNVSVWTPDGRSVVFATGDDSGKASLWSVAPTGGTPQRLAIDDFNGGIFVGVRPDGQITYEAGGLSHEVWTLENFLPSAPAKSTRR